MYLERLRPRELKSLEGFLMYAHYGRVGALPTYRESTDCSASEGTFEQDVGNHVWTGFRVGRRK